MVNWVKPEVQVVAHYPVNLGPNGVGATEEAAMGAEQFIERVARLCYKSEAKIELGSAQRLLAKLVENGHEAMLEHCVVSVRFVCDRGVTHELVRHRLAAYAQESTRYCNYAGAKFGRSIQVIAPPEEAVPEAAREEVRARRARLFELVEEEYLWEVDHQVQPQIARGVLPTALKTEIWMTANLREWRHVLALRLAPAAHPQMREIMALLAPRLAEIAPTLFPESVGKPKEE